MTEFTPHPVLVVMGVAGCGKSSLGRLCAQALNLPMLEGDDHHPIHNLEKMRNGTPLTDDDRATWLHTLGQELRRHPQGAVLTCSALKLSYRNQLRNAVPDLRFAFLSLTPEQARRRVAARPGHVFPVSLVDSQFEALQPPLDEPGVLTLDAMLPPDALCQQVTQWLTRETTHV
jgi:gluconokinase